MSWVRSLPRPHKALNLSEYELCFSPCERIQILLILDRLGLFRLLKDGAECERTQPSVQAADTIRLTPWLPFCLIWARQDHDFITRLSFSWPSCHRSKRREPLYRLFGTLLQLKKPLKPSHLFFVLEIAPHSTPPLTSNPHSESKSSNVIHGLLTTRQGVFRKVLAQNKAVNKK
jgi:hypothetical protein